MIEGILWGVARVWIKRAGAEVGGTVSRSGQRPGTTIGRWTDSGFVTVDFVLNG